MQVEDHPWTTPRSRIIPKGSYGAGQVIVWDAGTYSPTRAASCSRPAGSERPRARELAAGKLSVTLRGHKLKGSWTLVRTKRSPTEWLLIKHSDAFADEERTCWPTTAPSSRA